MKRFETENQSGMNPARDQGTEYSVPANLLKSIAAEAQNGTVPARLHQGDQEYLDQLTAAGIDINKPCYIPRSLLEAYLSDRATLENWAAQQGLSLL